VIFAILQLHSAPVNQFWSSAFKGKEQIKKRGKVNILYAIRLDNEHESHT
jgi:hypothetical protein